jgi:hypothetical protein
MALGKGIPNIFAVYFPPNIGNNCTACKNLNLALSYQAVEDDLSIFPSFVSRL